MTEGTAASAPASAEVTVTPVSTGGGSVEVPVIDVTPDTFTEEVVTEETPAVEEVPVVEPTKEKVAGKLAKMKAREAAAAQKEAAAAAKLAEAEAKLAEANSKSAVIERLKTQPSKVLAEYGLTFNDLATAILSEDVQEESTPSELDGMKQAIEDLKNKIQTKEQKEQELIEAAQTAQLETAIQGIKEVIDNHIEQNAEKYDLIRVTQNQDLVYAIMKESFDQTGEVMMYTDACDLAEDYLTDKAKALTSSRKIKEFVSPAVPDKPKRTSFGNTLSAQVTQVASSTGKGMDLSRLPHEERIKILAKQLRFN